VSIANDRLQTEEGSENGRLTPATAVSCLEKQPHLRSEVIASFGTSTFLRHTVESVKS
jgi:hypothetical protein